MCNNEKYCYKISRGESNSVWSQIRLNKFVASKRNDVCSLRDLLLKANVWRIVRTSEIYHNFRCRNKMPPIVIFRKGIISYHWETARGRRAEGSVCRRDLRRDGESGRWARRDAGESWGRGWPWSERDVAKNTSEESKGGNLRLKTPLSSRELNSNARVPRGARQVATTGRRGETATDVCAFLSRLATLMGN